MEDYRGSSDLRSGIATGLLAGTILVGAMVVSAALLERPELIAFRMFASVVAGSWALARMPGWAAFLLGTGVHLALSAVFGLIYRLLIAKAPAEIRAAWLPQAIVGLGYGTAIWLLDFQVVARAVYPWLGLSPWSGAVRAVRSV